MRHCRAGAFPRIEPQDEALDLTAAGRPGFETKFVDVVLPPARQRLPLDNFRRGVWGKSGAAVTIHLRPEGSSGGHATVYLLTIR